MSLFEQKSLLAKLMATENLIIHQANVQTASFDIQNRVLTVPILDQNLSRELYDLFMGHECGHALWTPLDGMKKARSEKVNMSILNVVEDSRIERKIKNKYPGIKSSFIKAYSELFDMDFFEVKQKDVSKINFIDRVNLHCKIGASLALPFTEEEKSLLNEVENTETFDDAIEVAKKICELMKDQLEEIEKQEMLKVKINVPVKNGKKSEESDSENKDFQDSEEEFDIEITLLPEESEESDDSDEKSSVESESQEGNEKKEGREDEKSEGSASQPGPGAGRYQKSIEEQIRSFTDDAYKRNEHNLFSKEQSQYVYGNIPVYDINQIMDYKVMIQKLKAESYPVNIKSFNEYRRESSKVVSYLVKEFELRKNAEQLKRAQTAKTGELNMNRLYSYNFTDDIFKKITVLPQGKSHGLVMFLDWSGSMTKHFSNTVKQLLNLVMFCKKVNIPFEVYCFCDSSTRWAGDKDDYGYNQVSKEGDIDISRFSLINLLSSRMSASDFTYASASLVSISGADKKYNTFVRPPMWMSMGGTPLNEAVIAAMEIVPEFQKRNRLQIVNTVFLTDGEGSNLHKIFRIQKYYDNTKALVSRSESYTHFVFRDPKTRKEEIYTRQKMSETQTDCLVRLLKYRTNAHVIGFFVGDARDVSNRISYFWPKEYDKCKNYNERDQLRASVKDNFRKNNSLVVTSTGFDDYYVLRSNGLDTDDEEGLTFKENATVRGMASAFSKYAGNKITSRVVLNRFIGLIS